MPYPGATLAHRGAYRSARDENTVAAFARALARGDDGFECDVRLSVDGVPVVVHDATLRRTHGVGTRVSATRAADLAALGVPTAEEVAVRFGKRAAIVWDVKARAAADVVARLDALARREGHPPASRVYLAWCPLAVPAGATVLRAREFAFDPARATPPYAGVACKYDGSPANLASIDAALALGLHVNLYAPDRRRRRAMLRRYGARCSITR
jgi:glycerophosphoryl diester phosphodiesterase